MDVLTEILREISIKISGIKTPLEKVAIESEPMFLNLGQDLQSVFSDAEDLSSLTIATARLIDGESGDNLLGNIGEFSRQSLLKLDACREEVSGVLPNVETCAKYLKRLQDMCPVIKQIAKKLNIVALNISMESSRTKECEDMFNFFVKEIKQLAQRVQDISVLMRNDSEMAGYNQMNDFKNITTGKNRLSDIADNARGMVEENINSIEELIAMSLDVLRRSGDHSKRISSLVGEVVEAIQFHDISRQQLEHVTRNMNDVELLLADAVGPAQILEGISPEISKAYSVINLQSEQIRQVVAEIHGAYIKIKGSFDQIGEEVETLVMDVARLGLDIDETGNGYNPFDLLISGLIQLDEIMNKGKEMARIIEENLNQSAETASKLANHLTQMEDISMDLHIKAINALIMSKRLGSDGKTLSVLAEDVTAVSYESNEFVLDVVEILKSIDSLAKSLSCLTTDESQKVQADSLSDKIQKMSEIYQDFRNNSFRSIENTKTLQDKISDLVIRLSFLSDIEEKLSLQLESIKEVSEKLYPFTVQKDKSIDTLSNLEKRYTMEVERGIHKKTLGRTTGSKEIIKEVQENKDRNRTDKMSPENMEDGDYLGDNVELF